MNSSALVFGDVDAVVFDVIGTLVDEDETWVRVATRLAAAGGLADAADLHRRWVELLGRHMDAVVAGQEPWRPHQELVEDAARAAITDAGGDPVPAAMELVTTLDSSYPAWPEVPQATAELRRHLLVVGLSNGDLGSLARLANANAISWDLALSTGAVRTFKPDPAAYRYGIAAAALDPERTLFVAAHPWDLRAAAEHGFRTAYVARPGAEEPAPQDRFDVSVDDVLALVHALAADPS
jgi:2-haloacid dehalogenase